MNILKTFGAAEIMFSEIATHMGYIRRHVDIRHHAIACLQEISSFKKLRQTIFTTFGITSADITFLEKTFASVEYAHEALVQYFTALKDGEETVMDNPTAMIFLQYIYDRLKDMRTYFEIQ
jgi:hypothetical protein